MTSAPLISRNQVATAHLSTADLTPPESRIDMLRGSLFLLIVLSISRIHQHFGFLGVMRPALLLAALALFSAMMNPKTLEKDWMVRWPTKTLFWLTCVTLGSIVFGISQGGSFYHFIENYSKVLVCAFLLLSAVRTVRDVWFFVWAYVVGSAVLVWMSLFVFGMQKEDGLARLSAMYTWDSNDIGLILCVALPLTLLTMKTSGALGKIFSMTMVVGIAATIARTGSRGAFLGLVILLLVYLLSLKGASVIGRIMVIAILFGGLTLTAPEGYWKQMNTITDAQDDYNWDADAGRRKLAIRGIGYMMRFPIFGLGLENFGRAEGTISERALRWTPDQPGIKWSVAHNSYLQAGAELGVGGFILFVSLVFGIIIHPWRLRRKVPKSWSDGDWEERFMKESLFFIPLAGLGFAIPGFFVSFAYNDPLYVIAALAGGTVACVKLRLQGTAKPAALARPQAPRRRVTTKGAAFQPPRPRLANPAASVRSDFPGSSTTT